MAGEASNYRLREDSSYRLREGGGIRLREADFVAEVVATVEPFGGDLPTTRTRRRIRRLGDIPMPTTDERDRELEDEELLLLIGAL